MRTRLRGRRAKNPTPEEPGEERAEQASAPGEQALHTLQVLRIEGGVLLRGDVPLAAGRELAMGDVVDAMEEARLGLSEQLENFVENTLEFLRKERELLLDGVGVPAIKT